MMAALKFHSFGTLLEEMKLNEKISVYDTMPTSLEEQDVPSLINVLSFLNNKDRDILFLTFVNGKAQTDIMKLLKRSQPSLSYDIKRIKERVGFICKLLSYFDDVMRFIDSPKSKELPSEQIMVMTLMYFTTSFSQSSRVSGLKPTRIRYIFDKLIQRLDEAKEARLLELFICIRKNLNAVRRSYKALKRRKKR
jgi:hypothetical protein